MGSRFFAITGLANRLDIRGRQKLADFGPLMCAAEAVEKSNRAAGEYQENDPGAVLATRLVSVAKRKMARKFGDFLQFSRRDFVVDLHVCVIALISMSKSESPSDVVRWLAGRTADVWPAGLGSLSLRRSPCIRENCPACLSGEQHRSYVLYGRVKGHRFSVYVPEELVPEVRRCLDNGRALQELLHEAAARYVKALKRERAKAAEGGAI
jgi:hypothetical protein